MTRSFVLRAVLSAVLSVLLAPQALADTARLAPTSIGPPKKAVDEIAIGIAAVAVVAVIVIVLIVRHKSHREEVTGCVRSEVNGMSVTDERDRQNYTLTGGAAGIKAGGRMTLQGKKKHTGQALIFEAHKVTANLGACPA